MRSSVFLAIPLILLGLAAGADQPVGVIVSEASLLAFPLTVEGLGTTRANEAVEVRSQVTERITAIHFEEGERVEAGKLLVELENSQALSGVAAARANLVASEAQYQRARELYKTNTVSGSELDQRSATRDADRAALRAAEGILSDTVIRAPFAGRIGLRRVSVGTLASPDTMITTLDDTATIKLDFDVPETALGLLEAGLPIEAMSAAWPETVFEGRVHVVDTRVDPISRTITVRAKMPNDDGRLRPGMFLTVRLLRHEVEALMIPEQAILPEQSKQFVLLVGEDQVVEKREVRTGRRRPGQVEVVYGLRAGEWVIAEGTQKARAGDRIDIVGRIELPRLGSGFEPDAPSQALPGPPQPAFGESGTP